LWSRSRAVSNAKKALVRIWKAKLTSLARPRLCSRLSPMHVAGGNVEGWLAWEHIRSALQGFTFSRSPASLPAPLSVPSHRKKRETAVGKRRRHATCNLRFPAYDRQQQKCQIGVHLSLAFHGAGAFMQLELPSPNHTLGQPLPCAGGLALPQPSVPLDVHLWPPAKVQKDPDPLRKRLLQTSQGKLSVSSASRVHPFSCVLCATVHDNRLLPNSQTGSRLHA
jgi:hypothetical protein